MSFKDKYTSESEKTKPENKDKKVISNDAFAIGELLEDKLERLRIEFIR